MRLIAEKLTVGYENLVNEIYEKPQIDMTFGNSLTK